MWEFVKNLQEDPESEAAQWRLMQANRGLVYHISVRYRGVLEHYPSVDLEDLTQAGFLALVPAALSYDAGRGKTWSAWAGWFIHRAIKKALGFRHVIDQNEKQTDAPPPFLLSLDQPISQDEPESGALVDQVEAPDAVSPQEVAERSDLSALVWEQVNALPDRQAQVVAAYDLEGETLKSVADNWGVSTQRVSDLRARGLRKLRKTCRNLWRDYCGSYLEYKSVSAFQRTDSSSTEDVALRRIGRMEPDELDRE